MDINGKYIYIIIIVDEKNLLPVFSVLMDEDAKIHTREFFDGVEVKTGKAGRSGNKVRWLAVDKEYDYDWMSNFLKKKRIQLYISRKMNAEKRRGLPADMNTPRF